MLSNIKTLLFLTMIGVFVAGCADIPSEQPAFPDFKSEMRILNATRIDTLLAQDTGDDPVFSAVFATSSDSTMDTSTVTTITLDSVVTMWIFNDDSTDSTAGAIDVTSDTVTVVTIDTVIVISEFAIRQRFFKDLEVNTGDLAVSVDDASVGTLAYEGETAYLSYPSGVYTISYSSDTRRFNDIVVTDSVTMIGGEVTAATGATTVTTAVDVVDEAVNVSANVSLLADQQSLVILHDAEGTNRVSLYHEKYMAEKGTGTSLGLVKVINTYSAGGALTVSVVDGANISTGLDFLGRAFDVAGDTTLVDNFFSGYAEVPVGSSVNVSDGGTLSETEALTVTAGKRQSLIIFGTGSGFKLSQLADK